MESKRFFSVAQMMTTQISETTCLFNEVRGVFFCNTSEVYHVLEPNTAVPQIVKKGKPQIVCR